MKEPRPATISARPREMRSRVATPEKTRTAGRRHQNRDCAGGRILSVRASAAERITQELSQGTPLGDVANAEDVQSDPIGS